MAATFSHLPSPAIPPEISEADHFADPDEAARAAESLRFAAEHAAELTAIPVRAKSKPKAPTPESSSSDWPPALDLEVLAEREPIAPASIMEGLPAGYATATFGHGGAGKSSIELQRAVCIAAGIPFCALPVERRQVLFISCEDRTDILHWRLTRVCRHLGIGLGNLRGWLQIIDLVGRESTLYAPDPRTGNAFTSSFGALMERIAEYGSELIVIDGITDTFGGNENARTEVKRYVNALVGLAPVDRGAVLLIGHVSKPTASNAGFGEGYSGSTAWHNSVRARWYLYPQSRDEDGPPERTGKLILELQKANLGDFGTRIEFQWDTEGHLFVGKLASAASRFDKALQERAEMRGIVEAMRAAGRASMPIPAATVGQRTAYKVLAARSEFPESLRVGNASVKRFWRLIERLRQSGEIVEGNHRRGNRHVVVTLALASGAPQRIAGTDGEPENATQAQHADEPR